MSTRNLLNNSRSSRKLSVSFTRTSSVVSISSDNAKAQDPDDEVEPPDYGPWWRDQPSGDILSQSISLTDLILGIYAIELWHYDESSGKLVNVNLSSRDEETGEMSGGGLLLKRRTQETDLDNDYSTNAALDAYNKLTDPSQSGYLPASDVDPGVGLPGALWAESRTHHLGSHTHDSVLWRDVEELANDPDQPYDERLQAFAKAGFKLAAAIPFDINGYRGMVIYFGNPHAKHEKLNNPSNALFMHNAAQLIGAAAAIQGPTEQIKAFREQESYGNWHRMKIKLLTIVRFGGTLRKDKAKQAGMTDRIDKPTRRSSMASFREASVKFRKDAKKKIKESVDEAKASAKVRMSRWSKKVQGGSAGIPPSFTFSQTLWSFIGVMTTHTILSRINLLIKTESDQKLSLILAPLGALSTLQYNLTAAPASQPRNAIFAQVFAISTAILLSYIPNVEPWFRSALAPAIVIPGMAKLGIIHPPAGAAAIVFSSGKFGWEEMGIFLAGVAISIITAVVINNLSDKRQYPTSWFLLNKAKKKLLKE